jgi:hypothetical protein
MNRRQPFLLPALWASSDDRLPGPVQLRMYRGAAIRLLRRYYRLSFGIGRLPSLLGREVFPSRLSRQRGPSFEDAVIFVHDVEQCLARLDTVSQMLIARIILQEYTGDEAAAQLECDRRQVTRRFAVALDRLCRILLDAGLLVENSCQAPLLEVLPPTDWQETE